MLENTQFALIATVHKLYSMVRQHQTWELGEPELNDRRQPVIHDIATLLGTIRPNSDIDLPVHSAFPEDESDLVDLAAQLAAQAEAQIETHMDESRQHEHEHSRSRTLTESESCCNHTDSSSEIDPTEFDDYRRAAFCGGSSMANLSPRSLTFTECETSSTPSESVLVLPSPHSYPVWFEAMDHLPQQQPPPQEQATFMTVPPPSYLNIDALALNQGLLESNFGALKPHVMSCPNPEVMMGVGDPMIFSGYDPNMDNQRM